MELREILQLHEKIKAGAERAAMVNAQTARVVATAKAAANNAAKDRDVALPLGAIDEAAAAMPSSEAMAAAPIAALPSSTAAVAASSASIRRSSRTQQPAAPVGDEAMARILQQEEQRGSRAGGASSDAAPAGVSHRSAASAAAFRAAEAAEAAVGEDVEAGEQDDEGDAAAEAGEEEDGSCAVCGGNESYGDDAIVFCDGCDVGMHQTCYGIHPVPEGQWFCESCAARRPKKGAKSAQPSAGKAVERSCPLCPVRTGAFKRTLDDVAGGWAHACCVLFHEGPGFTENVPAHGDICFLRKPAGFERVSQGLCKLRCAYCASPEDKAAGAKRQWPREVCDSLPRHMCARQRVLRRLQHAQGILQGALVDRAPRVRAGGRGPYLASSVYGRAGSCTEPKGAEQAAEEKLVRCLWPSPATAASRACELKFDWACLVVGGTLV